MCLSIWCCDPYCPSARALLPARFTAPPRPCPQVDFGAPLHCLVLAGEVHVTEQEMLAAYMVGESTPRLQQTGQEGEDGEGEVEGPGL